MISTQLPIVESKARPREIAAHCNGNLPISIQFVYSFQIIVPVVQRKEQGFLRRNWHFITLRQQSSQLCKLPFASSLHCKLRHPTSSGMCPFLGSRVTQRVTQN